MGVVRYIHIRAGAKALPISGIRIKGPKQDSDAEIGNTKQKKKNTKKSPPSMMSRSTTEKQETKVGTGQKTNTNLTNEGESPKTAEGKTRTRL